MYLKYWSSIYCTAKNVRHMLWNKEKTKEIYHPRFLQRIIYINLFHFRGFISWKSYSRNLCGIVFHKIPTVEFDFAAISVTVCDGALLRCLWRVRCTFLPLYTSTLLLVRVSKNKYKRNLNNISYFINKKSRIGLLILIHTTEKSIAR
jgi:hypothetical protein